MLRGSRAARSSPTRACRRTRRGHPRHPGRVRDRPRRPVHPAAPRRRRTPSRARHAFIGKWHGRLDGRIRAWAMPFSPETCRPSCCRASSAWSTSTGRPHPAPRQRGEARARLPGAPRPHAHRVPGVDRRARPERAAWPTRWAWTTRRSRAWRAPAPRWRCARSPRPRARAACRQNGRMPELLAAGVKVALGCDSPNNSNHLDMVRTMNMAAIQYKDARQDMRQVPAEAALEMATRTGAEALGAGRRAGLDRGGQARGPRAVRHPAAGVAGPLQPGQQPRLQRGRPQHPHRRSSTDGSWSTPTGSPSWTRDACTRQVQEIGERLLARTGVTFPRSRWPIV